MSLNGSLGNPIKNFQIFTLPYHSQMVVMAAMALLAELPEWQWYHNPALDSLLLSATSRVHLYIFLQHVFTVFVSSLLSTLRLHLTRPHYMRFFSLLYHLNPFFQLLRGLMPQRRTLQSPPLSVFLEAVMVHLMVLSLQFLWRLGSFLRRLFWGV